jgi:[ribosomal protein S5]-alanine N-acetyltransferase
MHTLHIQTEKLLLRPFRPEDIDQVYRGLSHPEVIRYYGVSYKTLEETKVQMAFFEDLERDQTGRWWAVCSPDDAVFYGAGGLNNWSQAHRKAEIGFWLLPEYWGQGLMQQAMPLICKHAVTEMNIHRIEGFVETDNASCKKAIEKLGFQLEGTMRDCEVKAGRFISLDIYSLIAG